MKKGQVKLSFGMIFSIILIIVFIVFAFFAIRNFLDLGETISTGKFVDDLQNDVNKLWKSSKGSQELEYSLPSGIDKVCFVNLNENARGAYKNENYYEEFERYSKDKNLFFYPIDSVELNGIEIEHILVGGNNPDCFDVNNGKVKIGIKKDFGEAKVSMTGFSVSANLPIGDDGATKSFSTLSLDGGSFEMIIPINTKLLSSNGDSLESIFVEVVDVSLDSSFSNVVGGVIYELSPEGATFDNPISVQLSYDESKIDNENNLIVVQRSKDKKETINDYSIDKVNNVVTANIRHFSSVALEYGELPDDVLELSLNRENFVRYLYYACLGREPDTQGYDSWVNALENEEIDGVGVAKGFLFSAEFQDKELSNEEFLEVLYSCLLAREPDTEGYEAHLAGLSGNSTREEIIGLFLNSEEFTNRCATFNTPCGSFVPPVESVLDQGERANKSRCSSNIANPLDGSGWNYCRSTEMVFDLGEDFDFTGSGCRFRCGELGYKSWTMWGWDNGEGMDDNPDCWCGNGELTKTHCTFRGGTCKELNVGQGDTRECRYTYDEGGGYFMWLRHSNNYDNLWWAHENLERSKGYIDYFDSQGYRYTRGDFARNIGEDTHYELCRQDLEDIPGCQGNVDVVCDNWCRDELDLGIAKCEKNKCFCAPSN